MKRLRSTFVNLGTAIDFADFFSEMKLVLTVPPGSEVMSAVSHRDFRRDLLIFVYSQEYL